MTEPQRPRARYPGLDILGQQKHWDPATRALILDRVSNVPPIRAFTPEQVATLQAFVDTVMPQDDRPPEERIPIVPFIDESVYRGDIPGYRHETMPDARTAWAWGLEGIDQTSQALYSGRRFAELDVDERRAVIEVLWRSEPPGEVWQRMPADIFCLGVLMGAIVDVYYAHPTAWNEIGYGGPAYPRGYYALNEGAPEHWEVEEQR